MLKKKTIPVIKIKKDFEVTVAVMLMGIILCSFIVGGIIGGFIGVDIEQARSQECPDESLCFEDTQEQLWIYDNLLVSGCKYACWEYAWENTEESWPITQDCIEWCKEMANTGLSIQVG